jgi:hypothetical protein
MSITGFVARPPEKLEIHYAIDDRVVVVSAPRCDQVHFGIKQLLEAVRAAYRALPQVRIVRQPVSRDCRIKVEKACVVVLLRFMSD